MCQASPLLATTSQRRYFSKEVTAYVTLCWFTGLKLTLSCPGPSYERAFYELILTRLTVKKL